MPLLRYEEKNFAPKTLQVIEQANAIIATYAAAGYDLTLRQLYYQFVSRDLIPNEQSGYKRLGSIVSDARRAGLIDWNAITDRTRNLRGLSHWKDPSSIVAGAANSYRIDKWATQPYRVEVWIEKDALAGVFERVCESLDIPYFSCRGYTSDSEMWAAGMRLARYQKKNGSASQAPLVLHFGDHDPSGIDMTRDIRDRLCLFSGCTIEVRRLALNMDQVEKYDPPPNPAKETDSRFAGYSEIHGDESWELDALEPTVLAAIVRDEIADAMDPDAWGEAVEEENEGKALLSVTSEKWKRIAEHIEDIYSHSLDDKRKELEASVEDGE